MRIVLLRHGATPGNAERRYVGLTDEPLSAAGRAKLGGMTYPAVEQVIVSPMKRCLETAALIYPAHEPVIAEGLRECDFGAFEYRSYDELKDYAAYQAWLDSGGTLPFPGGESRKAFSRRCCEAFAESLRTVAASSTAFIIHGGTIMAIMERFSLPKKDYYDYQVSNGAGFVGEWSDREQALTECRPWTVL